MLQLGLKVLLSIVTLLVSISRRGVFLKHLTVWHEEVII